MKEYPVLSPESVFQFFAAISAIPRESGKEKAVADYLVSFAEARNLTVRRDEADNVYIYKPGTPGKENLPPLILQGHVDMVCVKGPTSTHNFETDPIRWVVRDGFLYADDTTLGADNGIAVAFALAVLDSKDIPHPPLEVLLTTEEETGMGGAMAVHGDWLTGKALLNIDAEEEGTFFTSCAGGADLHLSCFCGTAPVAAGGVSRKLTIQGLRSGHSGLEIHHQRANAIQLLGRFLLPLLERFNGQLAGIQGGTKHNAIAASAQALFVFPTEADAEAAAAHVRSLGDALRREFAAADPDLTVLFEAAPAPEEAFCREDALTVASLLFQLPHGVLSMEPALPGLVRSSLNPGVLRDLAGIVDLTVSVRSSMESEKAFILDRLVRMAKSCGWQAEVRSAYPAWEYAPASPIRDLLLDCYKDLTKREANCRAIHAGLECGLLSEKLPGCDMISLGPDLFDVHTASEHLSLASVAFTWDLLKTVLAAYPGRA